MDIDAVKESLRPGPADKAKLRAVIARFRKQFMPAPKECVLSLGGSAAKDTQLAGETEIDFFAVFSPRTKNISAVLGKHLRKRFKKVSTIHGSRDYYNLKLDGYSIEVIPILKLTASAKAENTTDVSLLHAKWVKSRLSPAAKNEVRLLKAFCKALRCYGAESHIKGFSGYACEVLIANYGTFLRVLNASLKWKDKEVIDPAGHFRRSSTLKEMNASKTVGPLIIVDPVHRERNIAAALSRECLLYFQKAASRFLRSPDKSFFERRMPSSKDLIKSSRLRAVVTVVPVGGKPDVVGSKILKIKNFIEAGLRNEGFKLLSSEWYWDEKGEALIVYDFDERELPPTRTVQGPPSKMLLHAKRFRSKYPDAKVVGGRLRAALKRKYRLPQPLVRNLIRKKYITERCKKVNVLWSSRK